MARKVRETVQCQICQQHKPLREVLSGELVRNALAEIIRREHPDWSPSGYICLADLNHYRAAYVQHALEEEKGELSALEQDVIRSLREHELLSQNLLEIQEIQTELMEELAREKPHGPAA